MKNAPKSFSSANDTTDAMAVSLYIRVSTDRQANEGDSLEEQENELKKFCDYRRFKIHKIHVEKGKSGGNTNRPEYQRMIADVKAKKINAVVVKKIDRLSRSLLDFEAFMKLLGEQGMEFISIKENFDTTSAMGKAMLRVALVFAQLEREQTSERLRDVFSYRASQGLYNGGIRPYGYTTVNKELVPYPKEREAVEQMAKKFLDTHSSTQTAAFLNGAGFRNREGKLWDKRRVHHILQNPIYTGKVKWYDQLYQAIHQPIISDTQFEEIQRLFKNQHRRHDDQKTKAVLQGLLFCGHCHRPMTPSYSLNKFKIKYYYYRCTSTQSAEKGTSTCMVKYVRLEHIEARITDIFLSLSEEAHFRPLENRILKHNQDIDHTLLAIKDRIRDTEAQLATIAKRKDKYLDSVMSNQFSKVERDAINQRLAEMELEEKQLKGRLLKEEFEVVQKESDQLSLSTLKQTFIRFKANIEDYSRLQLKEVFLTHLKKVIYRPESVDLHFKQLPWPIPFPTLNPRPD